MRKNRGFTLVEILVVCALIVVVFMAAYYTFISSYQHVKTGTEKMHNVHAVAVLLELLRHELTALPDISNINEEFIKAKESDFIEFQKFETNQAGKKVATDFEYKLDKKTNTVIRTIGSVKQQFGRERVSEFKFTHNINPDKPNFPTWIRIDTKTIDDHKSEVIMQATIYPRLINRKIQVEQNLH